MKKYILNPISLFFIGAILGIISKLLDILFVGNLFMMTLGYMFSDLPIWVLLGILISIYSDTRKKAMINIFPFCIGMLISYYVTAELTNAVYSWNFIKGWTIFSCLSPLFAYFTWKTKEEGLFAKFISIGLILVTIIGNYILVRTFTIPDLIIIPIIVYFLFIKKVKRQITIYQDANKIFKRDYLIISLLFIDQTNVISYNMNIIS